jgi:signal transduction histidine kinase
VFRDASRERKFQDVLRRTEKLAAGARLGATIAHEINNPLEAIGNLIYLVKTSPGLSAGAAEDLRLAEHELDRVSHIARQTLGFYRESKMPDTVHIRNIVDTVLRLYLHRIQMKHIELDCNFEDCPPIQGIAGELQQLISNLICNALDAVADNGTLRVQVSSIEQTEGKAVQLKVEDDGIGISAEALEQIFEPFYTTKRDAGTGLGLWVSKQIAERHGGTIQAHSQNTKGARGAVFTVLLPCAADLLTPETEAVRVV